MMEVNNGESSNVAIVGGKKPLALERKEKLKVFAMLSIHKDITEQIKPFVDNKQITLGLSAAYSIFEAIEASRYGIKMVGQDPTRFQVPVMHIQVNADELIEMPVVPTITAPAEKPKVEKEKDQLISYVRFVFSKAANVREQKMAEGVIERFLDLK